MASRFLRMDIDACGHYTQGIPTASEHRDILDELRDCLSNGASVTWEAFIALAQPVIAAAVFRAIRRWGGDQSVVDDLIQDTFAKLCAADCRVLRNFRGCDSVSLHAYLRVIATSMTADRFRAERVRPSSLDDPESSPPLPDDRPAREIERNLLLDRVEKCLSSQEKRHRWIFWLYHRHGWSPQAISELPAVKMGKSGVETLLYRLTRTVADCMKNRGYIRADLEGGFAETTSP
jgi:RNA polymerase sigma factor (sigma-70 family)